MYLTVFENYQRGNLCKLHLCNVFLTAAPPVIMASEYPYLYCTNVQRNNLQWVRK